METVNIYNHTVEEYLLQYSALCEKLSDIETKRKGVLRDAVNKYMIFEISCIKNIEYNVPRYMESLGKMNDRLIIQDRLPASGPPSSQDTVTNLAKISIPNYVASLAQQQHVEIPSAHRTLLAIKKNTVNPLSSHQYHDLATQLYTLLDEAT